MVLSVEVLFYRYGKGLCIMQYFCGVFLRRGPCSDHVLSCDIFLRFVTVFLLAVSNSFEETFILASNWLFLFSFLVLKLFTCPTIGLTILVFYTLTICYFFMPKSAFSSIY